MIARSISLARSMCSDNVFMALTTVPQFVAALRRYELLDADTSRQLTPEFLSTFADLKEMAKDIFKRRWLTRFQIGEVAQGRAAGLVLGPYLLLDRVGEGGMGQVYKA